MVVVFNVILYFLIVLNRCYAWISIIFGAQVIDFDLKGLIFIVELVKLIVHTFTFEQFDLLDWDRLLILDAERLKNRIAMVTLVLLLRLYHNLLILLLLILKLLGKFIKFINRIHWKVTESLITLFRNFQLQNFIQSLLLIFNSFLVVEVGTWCFCKWACNLFVILDDLWVHLIDEVGRILWVHFQIDICPRVAHQWNYWVLQRRGNLPVLRHRRNLRMASQLQIALHLIWRHERIWTSILCLYNFRHQHLVVWIFSLFSFNLLHFYFIKMVEVYFVFFFFEFQIDLKNQIWRILNR